MASTVLTLPLAASSVIFPLSSPAAAGASRASRGSSTAGTGAASG